MISGDNWIFIKRICLTQGFWLDQAGQKGSRSEIMYKASKEDYYADWTLVQIERVEKAYGKLSRGMQFRKNKLQPPSVQPPSIQLPPSPSPQAPRSPPPIETYQDDPLPEIRTQYESDTRQNRYTDIRNQTAEPRHENRQFNPEPRQEDRPFISEPRYDRGPDRPRNRQYEPTEYAATEYADENPRPMNLTRRAPQPDYQAPEPYAPSPPPEVNQSGERVTYAKKLSALNKLYKDEEKFEDTENNFDFKLTIYLDKCKFADLPEHAYGKGVSLMLTGEALTYYYANRDNFTTFNGFCTSMRLYFEGPEWRSQNLDK
jgi:hypothetical protein